MTEEKQKILVTELSDALMSVNSAQCCFHNDPIQGSANELELEKIWSALYRIRNFYKEGLVNTQSKGEPEKTG